MPNMLTAETRKANPGLVATIGGMVKQGSVKGAVGGGKTLAARPESRDLKIGVKTLILVGMDDPIYAVEMQQKMHQDIKGSRLVIIPAASHAAIIEKPAAADAAILSWAATVR